MVKAMCIVCDILGKLDMLSTEGHLRFHSSRITWSLLRSVNQSSTEIPKLLKGFCEGRDYCPAAHDLSIIIL